MDLGRKIDRKTLVLKGRPEMGKTWVTAKKGRRQGAKTSRKGKIGEREEVAGGAYGSIYEGRNRKRPSWALYMSLGAMSHGSILVIKSGKPCKSLVYRLY